MVHIRELHNLNKDQYTVKLEMTERYIDIMQRQEWHVMA